MSKTTKKKVTPKKPRRESAPAKRNRNVSAVESALIVLELLAAKRDGLSTTAISEAIGFAKSSTSYLLRTLIAHGYVLLDPRTNKHMLGTRVLSLAQRATEGLALRTAAIPFLREIVDLTGLGAHLAILDSGDAVYIERIESPGFIKMDIRRGRRVAPQETAIGKALICHLEEDEVKGLLMLHSSAIQNVEPLMNDLAATRARGYAIDDEQHAACVRCVAAPVLSAGGAVVASIGVSGTKSELNDQRIHQFGSTIKTIASKLSAALNSEDDRA